MCIEAGITRTKNNISVAIKNISDFSLSILIFWMLGYGLMFGDSLGGMLGTSKFAFNELSGSDAYIHFLFQAMFCGTAATIISGAVAERCTFHGYLMITALTATLIYPIFGHWAWSVDPANDPAGWLGALGYYDFAGSGVVHAVGGGVALAAVLVLGPRDGRFLNTGQPRRFNGSNLPQTMLGVMLLWFGWIGFNGGSFLGLTDEVGPALLNTFLAGVAGVIAGLGVSWVRTGKPHVFSGMNGALAGLVAITASCSLVGAQQALLIGSIGGLIAYSGDKLLERLRIDDVVGAVPVHLFSGVWGMLAVAVFGSSALDASFLEQLSAQVAAIVAVVGIAFVVPFVLLSLLDRVIPLRVTQHVETIGLNVGEHGANTDLNELFEVMQRQAREGDLKLRAPQSPFTEVGQIGLFYNSVLFELEQSFDRVKQQQKDLSQVLEEKEGLIESVLPKGIAKRMTAGEEQIVDQIADASVVFIDIVDFTSFASSVSPQESMALLDNLFGRYDEVIRQFGLEKIKTIGDSYMYVAGVTRPQADHCAAAVDAALEILFVTRQVSRELGRDLNVRIGAHSGPLVAGLIGNLRFVYDLWGTTVNVAARIEEAGKPGKVSVSEAVVTRLGDEFTHQRQARVRLKGIGPTVLYSVEARRTTLRSA